MVRDDARRAAIGDDPVPSVRPIKPVDSTFPADDVTRILSRIEYGDGHSAEQLLPVVYDELRKLAAEKMAQEDPGQTLQATALVHEAYIRLVDVDTVQHWNSRGHFFAAVAEVMRRILIERARHKHTRQAGGGMERIDLDQVDPRGTIATGTSSLSTRHSNGWNKLPPDVRIW